MGQILKRVQGLEEELGPRRPRNAIASKTFPDLNQLPPEVSLLVLSHLNATDLCLASCVWESLGNDEILWHGLCRSQWQFVSCYRRRGQSEFSFKQLYMQLDEATLTFNADPELGLNYIITHQLVDDDSDELAKFLHGARRIDWKQRRDFLKTRPDILDRLVQLQNFENQFLPNALRKFFNQTNPPNDRSDYLSILVEKFSERFCKCNPDLGFTRDAVFVVCFSLIMLSVDLSSPHIKNKMSKREFIRNVRQAAEGINDDFAGHLYDNVYLVGHVAPNA